MLKNKLQELLKEFQELKNKIVAKQESIKQENRENEELLNQLLKEFKELENQLQC